MKLKRHPVKDVYCRYPKEFCKSINNVNTSCAIVFDAAQVPHAVPDSVGQALLGKMMLSSEMFDGFSNQTRIDFCAHCVTSLILNEIQWSSHDHFFLLKIFKSFRSVTTNNASMYNYIKKVPFIQEIAKEKRRYFNNVITFVHNKRILLTEPFIFCLLHPFGYLLFLEYLACWQKIHYRS